MQSITPEDKIFILDYLGTLPDSNKLCHYDFHPGNIMLYNGSIKIIDWMTAGSGNQWADVCRTSLILQSNIEPNNISLIERTAINFFRNLFYRTYIRRYLKITGGKIEQMEQWLLPVAAARLNEKIESEIPFLKHIIMREIAKISTENNA